MQAIKRFIFELQSSRSVHHNQRDEIYLMEAEGAAASPFLAATRPSSRDFRDEGPYPIEGDTWLTSGHRLHFTNKGDPGILVILLH